MAHTQRDDRASKNLKCVAIFNRGSSAGVLLHLKHMMTQAQDEKLTFALAGHTSGRNAPARPANCSNWGKTRLKLSKKTIEDLRCPTAGSGKQVKLGSTGAGSLAG